MGAFLCWNCFNCAVRWVRHNDVQVMFANIALVKAIMPGWWAMWDVKWISAAAHMPVEPLTAGNFVLWNLTPSDWSLLPLSFYYGDTHIIKPYEFSNHATLIVFHWWIILNIYLCNAKLYISMSNNISMHTLKSCKLVLIFLNWLVLLELCAWCILLITVDLQKPFLTFNCVMLQPNHHGWLLRIHSL